MVCSVFIFHIPSYIYTTLHCQRRYERNSILGNGKGNLAIIYNYISKRSSCVSEFTFIYVSILNANTPLLKLKKMIPWFFVPSCLRKYLISAIWIFIIPFMDCCLC